MTKDIIEEHPIDAVILWVDGNDEKHKAKMLPYLEDKTKISSENFRTRYDQVNEIKFTIDSILKFAPYIRNIFIVTDNQTPNFLSETNKNESYDKVSIIDHKVIFEGYEKFLPTFCSRTLETCIHRIPNLAEHFIYLNDDFFLIKETQPEDFFKNGYPVLRGKWQKFDENKFYKKFKKPRIGHKSAQQLAAKLAGLNKYYNFKHTPHPLRKSTFETYFKANREVFLENIKYKFRNPNQFLSQGLANHLEIKNKTCYFKDDLQLMYFRSYKKPLYWYRFKLNVKTKGKLFLGLQSLDRSPPHILDYILKWLEKRTS
ncbi:stealth family protein [Winogradskyella thalassocola]|uniref:Stealth protein CR1, conserved region 1 n=1 Tax=Winogradskyella thalassocola TaxID=262004 RepID=A0A1G8EUA6_9FLAO|nr:stealth family protein [Winogradskyella thalassocola]SDH73483.1 Stealth protein CR1, conserved region 1 [Winogradskyella thalassocola]